HATNTIPTGQAPCPPNGRLAGSRDWLWTRTTTWVYDSPRALTNLELEAELGVSDCCARPPSMIHINKNGTVIGSFDAPQGHGMDIDSKGFAYLGQDTVRKYETKTGKLVGEVPRAPDRVGGAP